MSSGTLTVAGQTLSTVEWRQRQVAAERFIEQSGDGVAMRALGDLRRSPESGFARLRALATSHTTLKVALGVFLGVIAAEAALALLRSGVLGELLGDIDAALRGEGMSDPSGWPGEPLSDPLTLTGNVALTDDPAMMSHAPEPPVPELVDEWDLELDVDSILDDLLG